MVVTYLCQSLEEHSSARWPMACFCACRGLLSEEHLRIPNDWWQFSPLLGNSKTCFASGFAEKLLKIAWISMPPQPSTCLSYWIWIFAWKSRDFVEISEITALLGVAFGNYHSTLCQSQTTDWKFWWHAQSKSWTLFPWWDSLERKRERSYLAGVPGNYSFLKNLVSSQLCKNLLKKKWKCITVTHNLPLSTFLFSSIKINPLIRTD